MSYDLYLHRKDNSKKPLSKTDEFRYDSEDGNYWTYASYGATPTEFAKFIKLTKDIGKALDTEIYDPQYGKNLDISDSMHDENNLFERGQKLLHHVINKFFIQPDTPPYLKFLPCI